MNALEVIKADHETLKTMLDEAMESTKPNHRAALLHRMRAELMAHERMEEDVFYPALRRDADARAIVLEGFEEHHVIDMILDELVDVPEDSEQWTAKLKVLKENIEHHLEEEEGEMFTHARGMFSKEQLEEIGQRMRAAKEAATA